MFAKLFSAVTEGLYIIATLKSGRDVSGFVKSINSTEIVLRDTGESPVRIHVKNVDYIMNEQCTEIWTHEQETEMVETTMRVPVTLMAEISIPVPKELLEEDDKENLLQWLFEKYSGEDEIPLNSVTDVLVNVSEELVID